MPFCEPEIECGKNVFKQTLNTMLYQHTMSEDLAEKDQGAWPKDSGRVHTYEVTSCDPCRWICGMTMRRGDVGKGAGSPTISLTIYKNGAYKNVQVSSGVD